MKPAFYESTMKAIEAEAIPCSICGGPAELSIIIQHYRGINVWVDCKFDHGRLTPGGVHADQNSASIRENEETLFQDGAEHIFEAARGVVKCWNFFQKTNTLGRKAVWP